MWSLVAHHVDTCSPCLLCAILSLAKEQSIALFVGANISHLLYSLVFLLEDGNVPEKKILLALSLWLSESTDIVGVVVRCLQLFIPYLSSTAETVKTKLTQMPMQDLCWVFDAYSVYGCDEQQNSLHTMCSKWFRPNPLCCQQQNHCHVIYTWNQIPKCIW